MEHYIQYVAPNITTFPAWFMVMNNRWPSWVIRMSCGLVPRSRGGMSLTSIVPLGVGDVDGPKNLFVL